MITPDRIASADMGRAARREKPRRSLAELVLAPGRDPVALVSADDADRLAWLLPERYRRMSVSAFTFYRGSAAVMAHDLAQVPHSGIVTQLCGDAHLGNFGVFASPERELLFDVNDFDETAVGPFEWDVLRLAASGVLAARESGFGPEVEALVARAAAMHYQSAMARYAAMGELELWYERVRVEELLALTTTSGMRKRVESSMAKARRRDAASAVAKLTETVDGQLRFREDPPLLLPLRGVTEDRIAEGMAAYTATLSADRRQLLRRFEVVDVAHKVVGVGSVGTRCLVVLLVGAQHGEPLILQFKEAGTSVLEPYVGADPSSHHGERVVNGQRVMQAASDIFLGWTSSLDGKHFYWRQLRDMKFSPDLATMRPEGLERYAAVAAQALARAHARGGNRAAIAAYVGTGTVFADAVSTFASSYAAVAEQDHEQMLAALADGRLPTDDGPVPERPFAAAT